MAGWMNKYTGKQVHSGAPPVRIFIISHYCWVVPLEYEIRYETSAITVLF